MDIKNPANIQSAPSGADKSVPVDFSSQFTTRTMKRDLETLSQKKPAAAPAPPVRPPFKPTEVPSAAKPPSPLAPLASSPQKTASPPPGLPIINNPPPQFPPTAATFAQQLAAGIDKTTKEKIATPPAAAIKPPEIKTDIKPVFDLSGPTESAEKKGGRLLKIIFAVGGVLVLATLAAIFYLWRNSGQTGFENSPSPSASPSSTPVMNEPQPLIGGLSVLAVEISQPESKSMLAAIKERLNDTDQNANLKIITVKITGTSTRYADLQDIADGLGLSLPAALRENTQDFNLWLYSGAASGTSTAREQRLLLALDQKDAGQNQSIMGTWEPTMVNDLKPMIFVPTGNPATPGLQEIQYHGGIFRYKNLPASSAAVNYVFYKNLIIIGTSKNSAYYAYDAASGQN